MVKVSYLCFIDPIMANGSLLELSFDHYQLFATLQIVLLGRICHISKILYSLLFSLIYYPHHGNAVSEHWRSSGCIEKYQCILMFWLAVTVRDPSH